MQSYESKMIVSQSEVLALKELIFNRARQRAEALADDTKTKYTASFRDEVMDIARKSFDTNNNPFAQNQKKSTAINNVEKQESVFRFKVRVNNVGSFVFFFDNDKFAEKKQKLFDGVKALREINDNDFLKTRLLIRQVVKFHPLVVGYYDENMNTLSVLVRL